MPISPEIYALAAATADSLMERFACHGDPNPCDHAPASPVTISQVVYTGNRNCRHTHVRPVRATVRSVETVAGRPDLERSYVVCNEHADGPKSAWGTPLFLIDGREYCLSCERSLVEGHFDNCTRER